MPSDLDPADRMSGRTLARVDGPRGEVVLRRAVREEADVLELRVNGVFVIDDAETRTERAMARVALARVERPACVLVGGLGFGYTLAEVLGDDRVERCDVAEIEQTLVNWMRDGTIPHGPALLADGRARLLTTDVGEVVVDADDASYDVVLLDVDNGPDHLVHQDNDRLYRPAFLEQIRRVLRPGGMLVVWSATKSPRFIEALRQVFGDVTAEPYDVQLGARDEVYWLHRARMC